MPLSSAIFFCFSNNINDLRQKLIIMVLIQPVYTLISVFPSMIVHVDLTNGNTENITHIESVHVVYSVILC